MWWRSVHFVYLLIVQFSAEKCPHLRFQHVTYAFMTRCAVGLGSRDEIWLYAPSSISSVVLNDLFFWARAGIVPTLLIMEIGCGVSSLTVWFVLEDRIANDLWETSYCSLDWLILSGRSGTVPTPLVVGLGAACALAQAEMEYDHKYISRLSNKLVQVPH